MAKSVVLAMMSIRSKGPHSPRTEPSPCPRLHPATTMSRGSTSTDNCTPVNPFRPHTNTFTSQAKDDAQELQGFQPELFALLGKR